MFSGGDASFHGSTGAITLNKPIVGIASTPSGNGYWMVASDGGIFSFGDAAFHGSTGATALNQPIVGMASTPSGNGYWLVAADGGIFSFGDAVFHGSTGAMTLNQPIVGMTSTASGNGYTLVAADGGIFSFGDAVFHGSTGATTLNQPIVGIASTPSGNGYWMVAADGGVFSFGDAVFHGSTGAMTLNQPIVGMAATPTGNGYWFVAADGGVFSFGDAHFFGASASSLDQSVVGMAASQPLPATQLKFTTEPGGSAAGDALSTQPVVTVQNAGNATATNDTSAVTLAVTTPDGATFACTANPQHTVAGVATFANCGISLPGSYTLTATDGALASAVSTTVTITPSATQLAFTTEPSAAATGGTAFVVQPSVTVEDSLGHVIPTDTSDVILTLTTPAGATLSCTPTTTKTAVAGVANFGGCRINRSSGTAYTLTATDGSLAQATSTGTTVSVGTASQIGFTTQPSPAATNGTAFVPQPSVAVQDAGGNTVTSNVVSITLSVTGAPGGVALACTGTTTHVVAAGVATFAGCALTGTAATYSLHATNGTQTGTSANIVLGFGTATHLVFTGEPGTPEVNGAAMTPQPSVTVEDVSGNTVTTANTITLSITGAPGGVALACTGTTAHTTTAGVATFAGSRSPVPRAPTHSPPRTAP